MSYTRTDLITNILKHTGHHRSTHPVIVDNLNKAIDKYIQSIEQPYKERIEELEIHLQCADILNAELYEEIENNELPPNKELVEASDWYKDELYQKYKEEARRSKTNADNANNNLSNTNHMSNETDTVYIKELKATITTYQERIEELETDIQRAYRLVDELYERMDTYEQKYLVEKYGQPYRKQ